MNREFACPRALLVQADFDGELDAAQAAALIEHERECAHCRRARWQLGRSRALLRAAPRYTASDELRERIVRGVQAADGAAAADLGASAAPSRDRPRLESWSRRAPFGWVSALAAAAALLIVVLLPRSPDVGSQLVANHVRAMQLDSHLIDVVSSDHHTVKPWFAGKVPFAPLVKRLDSDDYVLKGGRVDIVNGAPAAVLVYQAGRHIVELYQWPASAGTRALRASRQLDGFNLRRWEENGLAIWSVSDMSADELDRFVQHWRQ